MSLSDQLKCGLMFCVLGSGWAAPALAAPWPTTVFEFENKNPSGNTLINALDPFTGYSDEQKPAVARLEKYLADVALDYQSMGFKAPPLPEDTGRGGTKVYRVHLYDYDDGDPIARAGMRPDGSTRLHVDLSRAIENGKPVKRVFEDLAHELLHNVQHGYMNHSQIENRDWIVEGQAQAVGMYAAEKFAGVDMYKGKNDDYRLGGRPYSKALWDDDPATDEDYRTSSFWRYLAEHYAASKKNARAGVVPIAPDYSYLATILSQPRTESGYGAVDGRWLDRGLKQATGLGLQRLHAAFVTTFAGYVPDRLTSELKGTAEQAQDNWLKYVYGGCLELGLSPRAPSSATTLPLRKNGARCFKVTVAGTGRSDDRADVSLQARAETVDALKAFQIGTAGGERIGRAQIVESPAGGGYLAHWRFRIATGVPIVFIMSNMATNPANTRHVDLNLNATYSRWVSDLSQPRAESKPKAKSEKKKASSQSANTAKDATRQTAKDDMAAGLEALSNQTALGSHATFERERARCVQPFGASSCGPITSIQLSLTPGAMGDMTQTTGTGGALAQFMAQMTAIADHGVAQTDNQWKAALEEARDAEASSVTITIPLFDYGFPGSFSNAEIVVNGGAGRGNFQARGPEDAIPGHGQEYRQSGRVTIVEFNPYVMRGHFEADLTDLSAVDFVGEDMTLPIDRTIKGEFVIAAPWEGDRAVANYQQSSNDDAMQDLSQAFPALGNRDLGSILPSGTSSASSAGAGGSLPSSPVQEFPRCACDCQPIATLTPECKPICKVKLRACWAEDTRRRKLAEQQKPKAEPAATAPKQTREEYIEGLRQQGMSQAQIDRIMPGIDEFWAKNGGWPK